MFSRQPLEDSRHLAGIGWPLFRDRQRPLVDKELERTLDPPGPEVMIIAPHQTAT
jgi:hypothetical protein